MSRTPAVLLARVVCACPPAESPPDSDDAGGTTDGVRETGGDEDRDGIGEACDLCPRAFDPNNGEAFCAGDDDPAVNQATCPWRHAASDGDASACGG